MMMIVKLELGEQKRKILVERTVEESVDWIVGYIPNRDDAEINLEFSMMGVIRFGNYAQAETAFENYSI